MQAASNPSSPAESANSTASAGPMAAITAREAWLIRFIQANGSVSARKSRQSAFMNDCCGNRRPGLGSWRSPYNGGGPMVTMVIRHVVREYRKWRKVYDQFDRERRGM